MNMETNEEVKIDDIAARREARRRKILENSKSRMSRITGREDTEADDQKTNKEDQNEAKERIIYPDPDIERDVYVPQAQSFPPDLFSDMNGMNAFNTPFNDQAQLFEMINNLQQQTAGQSNANQFAAFAQFGNFDGNSMPNPLFANMNASETPKVPESRLQKFLNTKLHIGLISVLTYVIITFAPFRWNAFLIFLLWEIAEIFLLRQHESNPNGFINIIFMFAGISPNKVNVVLKWIQLLNKVLRDVALFMFFFIISHVCRTYWNGTSLVPLFESNDQIHVVNMVENVDEDVFEHFDL